MKETGKNTSGIWCSCLALDALGRNKRWKFLGHSHVAGTTTSSKSLHQNSQVLGQQAARGNDTHMEFKSQRYSTWHSNVKSSVVLSGKFCHVPEPPGWEDNHSQHVRVDKLAKGLGTIGTHFSRKERWEMLAHSCDWQKQLKQVWECSSMECLRSWAQYLKLSSPWTSTSDCLEPNQHQ